MKSISTFLSIILLIFFTSCKKEKIDTNSIIGNLTISKEKPNPGDSLKISYAFNNEILDSNKDFEPVVYYFVNNTAYPKDLSLTNKNNVWEGKIKITDSATAMFFNFKTGDSQDTNNKKGFIIPLHNENKEEIEGSNTSLGHYYLRYAKQHGIEFDKKLPLSLIEKDINNYPKLKEKFYINYLSLLYRQDKEKATNLINTQIDLYKTKNDLTEKDFGNIVSLFNTLKNRTSLDSINNLALKAYPNGNIAANKFARNFFNAKDYNTKVELFKEYNSKFKTSEFFKDYMLSSLARESIKNKNNEDFKTYSSQISNKQNVASLYNNLAWDLVQKDKDLDFASSISKSSLDLIQSSEKPNYLTESQHKKNIRSNFIMYADTYAWILFKQGNIKEAIKYQEDITKDIEIGKKDSHNLKQRLIEFLIADNQFEKAQSKAEIFVKNGAANSNMMPFFKQAYIKNHGSIDGFETLFNSLEKESKKIVSQEIKKGMLDEVAPDFKLKNLEGTEIALSDLKDKVVILDFWATWCGPCKASFPAMQTAVNKYNDNPNVVFLFIDTRERGTPEEMQKNALAFITKNKYSFNVLLDTKKDKDSEDFSTVSNYNVNGIPTKIIIGTDGKIKFKSVGYSGNADGLVQELDVMIEAAQS